MERLTCGVGCSGKLTSVMRGFRLQPEDETAAGDLCLKAEAT
jgi:hypothetical protein